MTVAAEIMAGADRIFERQGAGTELPVSYQVKFHNISYANDVRVVEAVQDVSPLRVDVT